LELENKTHDKDRNDLDISLIGSPFWVIARHFGGFYRPKDIFPFLWYGARFSYKDSLSFWFMYTYTEKNNNVSD